MPSLRLNRPLSSWCLFRIPDCAPSAPASTAQSRPPGNRARRARALTLVEVMFAMGILTMVVLGVLQGMLQSRRMTEGSIRQATVASLVQGYMEQFKSLKYAATANALPSSPATTPTGGSVQNWKDYVGLPNPNPVLPAKDAEQKITYFCLCVGAAPTSLPVISTLPTDASLHTESVDIDNVNALADNCTLNMWVWINPLSGTNVVDCKAIVIVYQWTVKDGGRIKYYSDMMRSIRSIVPTDG